MSAMSASARPEEVTIRRVQPADTSDVGRILYDSFQRVAAAHGFPPEFPDVDYATRVARYLIHSDHIYGIVAEIRGRIVGSNFINEIDEVRSIGPISVEPRLHNRGVGRRLMEAVMERAFSALGIRLVQDAFNCSSMSLYSSLGFDVKEPLAVITGTPRRPLTARSEVRRLEPEDVSGAAQLCRDRFGFSREHELANLPDFCRPYVALRGGKVTAYATAPTFWPANHAVAESEQDMIDLLSGVARAEDKPLGFILPTREGGLFRWALRSGLRVQKPMTLMALGEYQKWRGCYLPSAGY